MPCIFVNLVCSQILECICFVVSRIEAEGESLEMLMTLDVNTDVYPIKENEKHVVLLTSTLNKDGSAVGDYYTQVIYLGSFLLICACLCVCIYNF